MAVRNIIKIDEAKCNGCGKCVDACAEGAIQLINGKAKLISEVYCDGLGACIGTCPQDAITIEKREADQFDEKAVAKHIAEKLDFVCPGMAAGKLTEDEETPSRLNHWPVQLKLVPPSAPYLKGCDLLLVADCVPFAMGDFHDCLLKGNSVVVGCPKFDDKQFYIEKLASILKANQLKSLTVVHMEVPCCSGLTVIAREAIRTSGLQMAFDDVIIALQGNVLRTETIRV